MRACVDAHTTPLAMPSPRRTVVDAQERLEPRMCCNVWRKRGERVGRDGRREQGCKAEHGTQARDGPEQPGCELSPAHAPHPCAPLTLMRPRPCALWFAHGRTVGDGGAESDGRCRGEVDPVEDDELDGAVGEGLDEAHGDGGIVDVRVGDERRHRRVASRLSRHPHERALGAWARREGQGGGFEREETGKEEALSAKRRARRTRRRTWRRERTRMRRRARKRT